MKPKLFLLFILISTCISAQNNKGKFFLETGVKAFGGGDFLNYIGKTGFSFNEYKWETFNEDGSSWQKGTYNKFSWSVAPRLGYCLSRYFRAGLDFQYFHDKSSSGSRYWNYTSGLFFRFNFTDKKISPFLELGSGFGKSKSMEETISPGGANYENIDKWNLFYYSGTAGLSFEVAGNFNLNVSLRIQNTAEKEPENKDSWSVSYVTEKRHNFEIGPMLSLTYFLNKKGS